MRLVGGGCFGDLVQFAAEIEDDVSVVWATPAETDSDHPSRG